MADTVPQVRRKTDWSWANVKAKGLPVLVDVTFGLFVVWCVYVYVLYRFKVRFYLDDKRLKANSWTQKSINAFISLVIGYLTTRVGRKASMVVEKALRLTTTLWAVRYGIPPQAAQEAVATEKNVEDIDQDKLADDLDDEWAPTSAEAREETPNASPAPSVTMSVTESIAESNGTVSGSRSPSGSKDSDETIIMDETEVVPPGIDNVVMPPFPGLRNNASDF